MQKRHHKPTGSPLRWACWGDGHGATGLAHRFADEFEALRLCTLMMPRPAQTTP
jgi:hypothetical protein